MLPTILSRSQLIRLAPAPVPELAAYLSASAGVEAERAKTFAAYAEGRVGTALRLARNPAVEEEIGRAVELAEGLAGAPALRALRLSEGLRKLASGLKALNDTDAPAPSAEAAAAPTASTNEESGEPASKEKVGRRQLGIVIELLTACYRDLLALRLGGEGAAIVHGDRRERLARLAASRTPESWMDCLEVLLQARRRVDQNVSIPLLTDWVALKLVGA
jgi:hypothetical protein